MDTTPTEGSWTMTKFKFPSAYTHIVCADRLVAALSWIVPAGK